MSLFHRIFAGLTAVLLAAVLVASVGTFLGFDVGGGTRNPVVAEIGNPRPAPPAFAAIPPCVETSSDLAGLAR